MNKNTTTPAVSAVGWKAHPISTCGAFGGSKTHPTAVVVWCVLRSREITTP
ncbi:MAG: hypothetical protein IKZ88_07320 [Neisseriaceae bacterium]|nr:hypothetical protein [Neisseriaceae bacterium]